MKKRKPDILYDGFRNRFFDHESTPDPDIKEKIFTDYYAEESKKNGPVKELIHFVLDYKYPVAASITGLLLVVAALYLLKSPLRNDLTVSNSEKIRLHEIRKSTIPEKEIIMGNNNVEKEKSRTESESVKANDKNKNYQSELLTYKAENKKLVVFLPDSSKVYLNKYSELSYSENLIKGERIVNMKGEIYFDVKKSKNRPFIVSTKTARVEVLGTSFSIKSFSEGREEVIVESGKVLFSENGNNEGNKILLTPGMKAYLDPGNPIVNVLSDHVNDLSWKTNKMIFNETPIKEVIEKIQSYFDVKVNFNGSKILDCHFTGTFDQPKSLEGVLEIISLSINGSYEIKNKEYLLTSKGCN
jgi:hypothetical protein